MIFIFMTSSAFAEGRLLLYRTEEGDCLTKIVEDFGLSKKLGRKKALQDILKLNPHLKKNTDFLMSWDLILVPLTKLDPKLKNYIVKKGVIFARPDRPPLCGSNKKLEIPPPQEDAPLPTPAPEEPPTNIIKPKPKRSRKPKPQTAVKETGYFQWDLHSRLGIGFESSILTLNPNYVEGTLEVANNLSYPHAEVEIGGKYVSPPKKFISGYFIQLPIQYLPARTIESISLKSGYALSPEGGMEFGWNEFYSQLGVGYTFKQKGELGLDLTAYVAADENYPPAEFRVTHAYPFFLFSLRKNLTTLKLRQGLSSSANINISNTKDISAQSSNTFVRFEQRIPRFSFLGAYLDYSKTKIASAAEVDTLSTSEISTGVTLFYSW